MKKIALLRGVTPTGKNRIPSMAHLAQLLEGAGFSQVQTYLQSGNLILCTSLSDADTRARIHQAILDALGADLAVLLKEAHQLARAAAENPFGPGYDPTRVHLVFTNDPIPAPKLEQLQGIDFGEERFQVGRECLYCYLPREAKPKRLNTNYLEKHLGITATTRKLSVVTQLAHRAMRGVPSALHHPVG